MRTREFVFLFISFGCSFASSQNVSSETENPSDKSVEQISNENQNRSTEKPIPHTRQQKQGFLIAHDPNLVMEPRFFYSRFPDGDFPLAYIRPGKQRQNIYLSDNTGHYDLRLQNIQKGRPSDFQTALGAISAHIINQRTNQEYIPYPPNGDPRNYPAYRGHPRATEPPVIRAYERSSNANYDAQQVDLNQQNPIGLFTPIDYQPVFPNQFENSELYNNAEFFKNGAFYSEVRRSDPQVFDPQWYNPEDGYQRPIK